MNTEMVAKQGFSVFRW